MADDALDECVYKQVNGAKKKQGVYSDIHYRTDVILLIFFSLLFSLRRNLECWLVCKDTNVKILNKCVFNIFFKHIACRTEKF